MRLLARRTGRGPDWRDKCPLEERAAAVGVKLKLPPNGKEVANIRANERSVLAKEEAYLVSHPFLPPNPASRLPTHRARCASGRRERALAFERTTGEFSLGTCVACRETRLNATYRESRGGEKICLMCHSDKQVIYTYKNNAPPTWRDADGGKHYDVPVALSDLTIAEKLLIARLSATVTIQHLSHGGVASTGYVATFPKPVEPMAAVLPRLPSDVAIIRVRRGAAASADKKQNRLYTARRGKGADAIRWRKERNPYYADVVLGPSRLADVVEGQRSLALKI